MDKICNTHYKISLTRGSYNAPLGRVLIWLHSLLKIYFSNLFLNNCIYLFMINICLLSLPGKYEDSLKHDSRVQKFHHVQQSIICITNFRQRGRLKNAVYKTNPRTLEELRHNIHDEINNINRGELQRVMGNFVRHCGPGGRMRACHAAGPGSIPGRDKFSG